MWLHASEFLYWTVFGILFICLVVHKKVTEKLAETWWQDCRQNQSFSKVIHMVMKNWNVKVWSGKNSSSQELFITGLPSFMCISFMWEYPDPLQLGEHRNSTLGTYLFNILISSFLVICRGHSNKNWISYIKWFITNTRDSAVTLIFNVVLTMFFTHTLTFHKFLWRRSLLVVVLSSCAPPPLPPQTVLSDTHVECLSGAKRGDYHRVSTVVNMADEVTLSILNPVCVSCYDWLYDAGHCHAVDTPEDNKPWGFLWVAGLSWFQSMSLYLTLFINLSYHELFYIMNFIHFSSFLFEWPL